MSCHVSRLMLRRFYRRNSAPAHSLAGFLGNSCDFQIFIQRMNCYGHVGCYMNEREKSWMFHIVAVPLFAMLKPISDWLKLKILMILLFAVLPATSQENPPSRLERSGTAAIRGSVTASEKGASMAQHVHDPIRERYTTHGTSENTVDAAQPTAGEWRLSERVVLYLERSSLDQQAYPVPEKHPALDQRHLEFHPRVLPILAGTTVDFPNRDNLFHNVFSYSQPREFDLGRYPKNDSRSVTFDEPGVVRVYCDIHSHMNATILVLQNPYFAVPADDGTYAIRHIPEGKYTLVVWYDRDVVERRPVELKSGETIELNFNF